MKTRLIIFLGAALLLTCSNTGKVAGTITDTDTGSVGCKVQGLIALQGSVPASDAIIKMRDQSILKTLYLGKTLAPNLIRLADVATDINGFFEIDSIDTGSFLFMINYRDSLGAIVPRTITKDDTLVRADTTLGLLGTVQCMVDDSVRSLGGIRVYIPEIDLWITMDSTGFFQVKLPVWVYHFKVFKTDVALSLPTDTLHISVSAGEITEVLNLGVGYGNVVINGTIKEIQ